MFIGGLISLYINKDSKIKIIITIEMILITLIFYLIILGSLIDNIEIIKLIIYLLCISAGEIALLITLIINTKKNFDNEINY